MQRGRERETEGGAGRRGREREVCCLHAPVPHEEHDHGALQMCSNIKIKTSTQKGEAADIEAKRRKSAELVTATEQTGKQNISFISGGKRSCMERKEISIHMTT